MSEVIMTKEATPKKVAFVSKPYSQEERIKRDEEELEKLKAEQKGETEKVEETEEEKLEKEKPANAEEKTFKKRYGDLRRHIGKDLLEQKAIEIMSKSPKTIEPNAYAIDAIKKMAGTITSLFVIEDNKVIGLLRLHDCIRAGLN